MSPSTDPLVLLAELRDALAAEFEIEGFVGRGSVALLYKGVERTLERAVAIKVVPPGGPPGFGDRVRREARVASNLAHPNIVPIYKAAQAAGTDLYTMKWVEGCSLDWVLVEEGPLPVPLALTVLLSVARALAYAHDRHVLHRDLRGAKILVDREGIVAVTDTGVARALRDELSEAAVGSPLFRSPEQCSGQPVGPQADQYAFGALAFQILVGQPPFSADSQEALLALHVSAPPPDIGAARPDVPRELADVIRRALTKTPAERYATTREMLLAIQAVPLSEEERDASVARLRELALRAPQPVAQRPAGEPAAHPVGESSLREMDLKIEKPPASAPTARPARPSGLLVPLPAPPPAPIAWEPRLAAEAAAAPPPKLADIEPPRPTSANVAPPRLTRATSPGAGGWGPPAQSAEWEPAKAPPTAAPRPSRPVAAVPPTEERRAARASEPALRRPSVERKAEPLPRSRVLGRVLGVLAVVVITFVAVLLLGKRVPIARDLTRAPTDSAKARERADSIATFAPVPTVGWVKVNGDLPGDAVFWLDDKRMKGRVFPAAPGRHSLEVQTDEFEPWKSAVRVRLGDTLRVDVELVLIQPHDSAP